MQNAKFYFLFESLNTASRILLIEIANILKKTNPIPSHPNKTVIDNKLEPKSCCSRSVIFIINELIETIHIVSLK